MFKSVRLGAVALMASVALVGCNQPAAPDGKTVQAEKAQEAADSITFTRNAEIENIKDRLTLTSDPDLVGYVLLLNEMGQPIMYTAIKGKITSSGKRLTPPVKDWGDQGLTPYGTIDVAPSDEGTWGSSDPYVYFTTIDGQYMQWNGKYLYSNQPFRVTSTPLVVIKE